MTPREKLDARIANERLKLLSGLPNSLAASALVGSVVAPFIAGAVTDLFWSVLVAGLGCVSRFLGHLTLEFLKPEQ